MTHNIHFFAALYFQDGLDCDIYFVYLDLTAMIIINCHFTLIETLANKTVVHNCLLDNWRLEHTRLTRASASVSQRLLSHLQYLRAEGQITNK